MDHIVNKNIKGFMLMNNALPLKTQSFICTNILSQGINVTVIPLKGPFQEPTNYSLPIYLTIYNLD